MFGDGGNGGQKGGKLLARIGRAATFRAGGGEERGEGQPEEQGRRRRGWLKHLPILSKGYASKNKSEVVGGGGGGGGKRTDRLLDDEEEGRWSGGVVEGRVVQGVQQQGGSRLMQLGQKLESSDDSGRESGYTRFLNSPISPSYHSTMSQII